MVVHVKKGQVDLRGKGMEVVGRCIRGGSSRHHDDCDGGEASGCGGGKVRSSVLVASGGLLVTQNKLCVWT